MKNSRKLIVDSGQLFTVFSERSGRSASCGHRTAHPFIQEQALQCLLLRGKPLAVLRVLLFAIFSLLFPVFSYAEELPDPTLPPASISAPVAVSGVVAATPPAGLQSIIIGRHRRAAIIDGQTVELGGRLGDAKLVEVNTANVVLRTAQGRQVLTLFPDVKITSKSDKADSPSNREKVHAGTYKPVRAMEKK